MIANGHNMSREHRDERERQVRVHLAFCIQLHEVHDKASRHLLHEHRLWDAGWRGPGVGRMASTHGAARSPVHMCRHGVTQWTQERYTLVKDPTGFTTNSFCVADRFNLVRLDDRDHARSRFSRAQQGQMHPCELCTTICKGFKQETTLYASGLCILDSTRDCNEEQRE